MKKVFYLFLFISCLCVVSCKTLSNSSDVKLALDITEFKVSELEKQLYKANKTILELQEQLSEANKKAFKLEKIVEEKTNNEFRAKLNKDIESSMFSVQEIHALDFTMDFYAGCEYDILEKPLSSKIIGRTGANCTLRVTNYLRIENNAFIQVFTKDSKIGYIKVRSNPYSGNTFSYLETIDVYEEQVNVLVLEGSYGVSEIATIWSLPTQDSLPIHFITHAEGGSYHQVSKITEDFKWVFVTVNEISGWVPIEMLYRDIGGPTVYTPENTIKWELVGSNLI